MINSVCIQSIMHPDVKKLQSLLIEKRLEPSDFESAGDEQFIRRLLRKEDKFTRKNLSRLSELLGINAFELFRSGGTIIHGDSNITATNGSKIRLDAMEQELKKLKKDYKELQKKYIALLEKLADP